jgi:hypothetical protein
MIRPGAVQVEQIDRWQREYAQVTKSANRQQMLKTLKLAWTWESSKGARLAR